MSIAVKLRILAVGLVAVTALVVGLPIRAGFNELLDVQRRRGLDVQTSAQSMRLKAAFTAVRDDVLLLSELPDVADLSRAPDARSGAADRVAAVFTSMIERAPYYRQIRYIGVADGGREVVRVDRRGAEVARVAAGELQHKGNRDYFREGVRAPPGEVLFSRIELNREHGEIEVPHVATLRASSALTSAGKPAGIVIINLGFGDLVGDLFREIPEGHDYYICDETGQFVFHPDPDRTFAADLGHEYSLASEFGESVAAESREAVTRHLADGDGRPAALLRMQHAHVFPTQPERYLLLLVSSSSAGLVSSTAEIVRNTLTLGAAVLLAALVLAYVLSYYMVRPLLRMRASAADLAAARRPRPLPVERSDEIGELARALDHLVKTLQNNEARLRRSNHDLEQFAFTASHDLQEPLRMVTCYIDLLERSCGDRLEPSEIEFMRFSRDGAMRMKGLVDGLLDFARVESRGAPRRIESCDDILDGVLRDLEVAIEESHARIERDSLPRTRVDRSQMARVFQNLVGNAIKFRRGDAPTIRIRCRRAGVLWLFSVADDGIGFDSRHAERLFQIFQRLHRSDEYEGTGVGLSIARRIVERHGGRMWAESTAGEGSTFFFTIPVEDPMHDEVGVTAGSGAAGDRDRGSISS